MSSAAAMGYLATEDEASINDWIQLPVVSTHNWTRRALLIGQDGYRKVDKLRSAVKDVERVAELLKKMSFDDVKVAKNLTSAGIRKRVEAFCNEVQDHEISVVYFAGHCAAQDKRNYLLGIECEENKDGVELSEGVLGKLAAVGKQQIIVAFIDGNRVKRSFAISGDMNKAGQHSHMIAPELPPAENIHVVLGSEPNSHHLSPAFKGRPSETFFTDLLLQELDSSQGFVEVMEEVRKVAGEATKGVQHPACYHVGELSFGLADTNDSSPQALEERMFHIQLASSMLRNVEGLSSVAAFLTPKMVSKDRSLRWEFEANEEKFLDLSGEMLGDHAVLALSTLLRPCCCSSGRWMSNPSVQGINLSANNLTGKGAFALASVLAPHRNPSRDWIFPSHISSLQLHQNYVSDEGCAAILGMLAPKQNPDGGWAFNSSMRHLRLCSSICNNELGEKTAATLVAVFAVHEGPDGKALFNNSLTEIELDGNNFSAEAREQIQAALEKLNEARALRSAVTTLRSVGMDAKVSDFIQRKSHATDAANKEVHMKTALNNFRKGKDRPALKLTW